MLETLLGRALHSLSEGAPVTVVPKSRQPLLRHADGSIASNVIPDGALKLDGSVIATFECKYTVPQKTPKEDHVHQALSTAAVLNAPLAVLVYPTDEAPTAYTVAGFHGHPAALVTVGLSLYSYQKGTGARERAEAIRSILHEHQILPA